MRVTLATAALLLSATSLVHANSAETETYSYGTQLDIASVMSVKIEPTPYCKVTDAVMTYRDSSGEVRKLAYRTLADSCKNQN
ncbi:DUF2790 domain-containing protein [Stutzerimonas zhaodongensis]|uniref:DUF2790 domain-containing protein n=1 Tax=Stutzerimonas zhaodongensis TaxID=1176257 RepID=A0A3M2HNM3_9GAMM|nr:DUF2790 domain-containing protein [Stutzerimonas zhaodongensis]MCQ2030468.1 DUF2790 domain-containing protein [Stutzerimonas zhaodongensis]MCQ4317574.1 DUF2790 domain-containing protein [Stutzerimonas zhaodongensis]RMH91326.1 DUF2790 domain-containing protein [Stutzerimonas zhaodongensis]